MQAVAAPDRDPVAEAVNAFGFDLYLGAAGSVAPDANLLVSPFSASVALGMTLAGARGETQRELSRVLHLERLPDPHGALAELGRSVDTPRPGLELRSSNRVWAQQGLPLDARFVELLGQGYRAPVGSADMAGAPETALETINAWVASRTDGRIAHLLDAGTLAARPLLVLVNALYFRGEWLTAFDPARTTELDFHTPRGDERVRYMRTVGELRYGRVAGAKLLELPFRGGLDLLIVLPEAADGLPGIERRLLGGYERWTRSLTRRTVHAGLPRWESRTKLELGETLRGLGARTAFGPNADFSGMLEGGAAGRQLSLGAVIQEATASVDERGATVAAATAVGMYGLEARDEAEFNAVHPFLFFVRHTASGAVLLIGRVMNPKAG